MMNNNYNGPMTRYFHQLGILSVIVIFCQVKIYRVQSEYSTEIQNPPIERHASNRTKKKVEP